MELNTRKVMGKYTTLELKDGQMSVGSGLLDKQETIDLAEKLRSAAENLEGYILPASRVANFKEDVQTDILTCVDGFTENSGMPQEDVEKMKEALCQIILDKVVEHRVM